MVSPLWEALFFSLINTMWWGIVIGIFMVAIVAAIPQEFVLYAMGRKRGLHGVIRAALAGICLDLCNHGILMVGATPRVQAWQSRLDNLRPF